MATSDAVWFRIDDESAIGAARRSALRMAKEIHLSDVRAGETAIVVTEAASNLHRHAADGSLLVHVLRAGNRAGIRVVAMDAGPGMADPARSARDGYSTTGTLGIGLGAIERLSSWSQSVSVPGEGTVLVADVWNGDPPARPAIGAITRALAHEEVCGDAVTGREDGGRVVVLVVDGLGHGPLAAHAAGVAVRAFEEHPLAAAGAVVTDLHRALSGTRGAALAVADLDTGAGTVTYAGIGNIAGWIVDESGRRGMVSLPGIAGHNARRVREWRYDLPPGARVVLHSDGLTGKWPARPALLSRDPVVAAALLLRDAGTRHDDASVAVVGVPWTS